MRCWIAAGALAFLIAATPSAAGDCGLEPSGQGLVAEVLNGNTVRLADGTDLRLVNVLAPDTAPHAEAARQFLHRQVHGRRVHFAHGGREMDRHGRQLVHLYRGGRGTAWVQGELVDRGFARVYSFDDNRACVAKLLGREAAAREARRGLWAADENTVLPAGASERVLAEAGRHAIVEGVVLSVGERRLRTYLDFGPRWNRDFTVVVSGADRDRIAEAGMDLGGLQDRTVRVRGWILEERGPAIMATHPEQFEIVED